MIRALALSVLTTVAISAVGADTTTNGLVLPPFPCLTREQPSADLSSAYRTQRTQNQQREQQEPLIGYKAGLTTAALQQRFRSSQPVLGALFQRGERTPTAGIRLSEFGNAKLETEIGFIVAKAIKQPLRDISELRQYFTEVLPVIEVPDVSFVSGCQPNAVDLTAVNVAAFQHIRGEPKPWAGVPALATLTATLKRDGDSIASGAASAVQPSVEASLLFLVNEALKQGYAIKPGQLFITGAMSGLIDAKPGEHFADFGALGSIRFTVQP